MDSDQGKLFIGGISWETDEEKLKDHFQSFGEVLQTVVMRDKITGKPRGFGFVVFADPNILDSVLQETHTIDGRTVEAKRAISKEEQVSRTGNSNGGRSYGGGGGGGSSNKTKKIFVGGLPPALTEDGFRGYFEAYGNVTDVVIMYDQQTNRPRGFGFISFDSEDAVDQVLHKTFHDLNGKQVEVKRALPKDFSSGSGSGYGSGSGGARSMGGSGGGYQGYGGGGGNNPNSYDSHMDSKYAQQQNTVSGYSPYASSGYPSAGYGYGPSNNAMGSYGGYGGYGGGATPGYGGPAASVYGNQNLPGGGYGSGSADGQRSSWNPQGPAYGGNMGYGGVGGGGNTGHSPAEAAGYGSQSYGYGGYDGSYGNQASYGAVGRTAGVPASSNSSAGGGGEMQSGGYGVYGDASGNYASQASGNYGTNGNQGGYGGGYGGGPARQTQQQ
ncbi:unnamed protein product [Cuscuta epithymum]|uniref:RRM domain-containing protein n=1 Tax=Cuscuta epithymum TaxID=186058 RepID=A0AAV0D492_9ASTE|nr:unnamed protein product [Cuscuta epithymum]